MAATVRRPVDNAFTDHRRYGDPTYLAPSRVRLEIIDTRTGARDVPFKELVNVRTARWSQDGRELAILLAREAASPEGFPSTSLFIWSAEKRALREVKPSQPIALNSSLDWTNQPRALLVALRNAELDREARKTFATLTDGPIIVHKSSEPFLEWDLLQRSTRTRSGTGRIMLAF